MTIRPETEADIPPIDRINLEAFQNHPCSHQTEHLLIRALRAAGALTLRPPTSNQGKRQRFAGRPALASSKNRAIFIPVAFMKMQSRSHIADPA